MAYLPFYLTPEEFELKQKQQEQEIAAGRGQIRWHKYDIEKPFRYFNYCISIAVCLPSYLLAFVLFERGETFSNALMNVTQTIVVRSHIWFWHCDCAVIFN